MSILMYFSMNFNNYLQKFLSMFIFFRKIAAETPEFWKAPFPPTAPNPLRANPSRLSSNKCIPNKKNGTPQPAVPFFCSLFLKKFSIPLHFPQKSAPIRA